MLCSETCMKSDCNSVGQWGWRNKSQPPVNLLFLFSCEIHTLVCCEFCPTCLSPEFSLSSPDSQRNSSAHMSPFEEPSSLNGRQNQKLLQSNGGAGTSCALWTHPKKGARFHQFLPTNYHTLAAASAPSPRPRAHASLPLTHTQLAHKHTHTITQWGRSWEMVNTPAIPCCQWKPQQTMETLFRQDSPLDESFACVRVCMCVRARLHVNVRENFFLCVRAL